MEVRSGRRGSRGGGGWAAAVAANALPDSIIGFGASILGFAGAEGGAPAPASAPAGVALGAAVGVVTPVALYMDADGDALHHYGWTVIDKGKDNFTHAIRSLRTWKWAC